eukprot:Clim_evm11s35 gene=Clim_evmTU11s35
MNPALRTGSSASLRQIFGMRRSIARDQYIRANTRTAFHFLLMCVGWMIVARLFLLTWDVNSSSKSGDPTEHSADSDIFGTSNDSTRGGGRRAGSRTTRRAMGAVGKTIVYVLYFLLLWGVLVVNDLFTTGMLQARAHCYRGHGNIRTRFLARPLRLIRLRSLALDLAFAVTGAVTAWVLYALLGLAAGEAGPSGAYLLPFACDGANVLPCPMTIAAHGAVAGLCRALWHQLRNLDYCPPAPIPKRPYQLVRDELQQSQRSTVLPLTVVGVAMACAVLTVSVATVQDLGGVGSSLLSSGTGNGAEGAGIGGTRRSHAETLFENLDRDPASESGSALLLSALVGMVQGVQTAVLGGAEETPSVSISGTASTSMFLAEVYATLATTLYHSALLGGNVAIVMAIHAVVQYRFAVARAVVHSVIALPQREPWAAYAPPGTDVNDLCIAAMMTPLARSNPFTGALHDVGLAAGAAMREDASDSCFRLAAAIDLRQAIAHDRSRRLRLIGDGHSASMARWMALMEFVAGLLEDVTAETETLLDGARRNVASTAEGVTDHYHRASGGAGSRPATADAAGIGGRGRPTYAAAPAHTKFTHRRPSGGGAGRSTIPDALWQQPQHRRGAGASRPGTSHGRRQGSFFFGIDTALKSVKDTLLPLLGLTKGIGQGYGQGSQHHAQRYVTPFGPPMGATAGIRPTTAQGRRRVGTERPQTAGPTTITAAGDGSSGPEKGPTVIDQHHILRPWHLYLTVLELTTDLLEKAGVEDTKGVVFTVLDGLMYRLLLLDANLAMLSKLPPPVADGRAALAVHHDIEALFDAVENSIARIYRTYRSHRLSFLDQPRGDEVQLRLQHLRSTEFVR